MTDSLGAIPGSRKPDPSFTDSGPTGFDPERIDALACECERQVAIHLDTAHASLSGSGVDMLAIDRAIAVMDRVMRLRELLAIAIAMETQRAETEND